MKVHFQRHEQIKADHHFIKTKKKKEKKSAKVKTESQDLFEFGGKTKRQNSPIINQQYKNILYIL